MRLLGLDIPFWLLDWSGSLMLVFLALLANWGWRDDPSWRERAQGMVLYDLAIRGIAHRVLRRPVAARIDQAARVLNGDTIDLTARDSRA